MAEYAYKRRHRRRKFPVARVIAIVVVALVVVSAAFCVLVLRSALAVRSQAQELVAQADDLGGQIQGGDLDAARATARDMAGKAAAMHDDTNAPWWLLGSALPVVGQDIASVRTLAAAADTLVSDALVPLVDSLAEHPLSGLIDPETNAIDVAGVTELAGVLAQSAPSIHEIAVAVEELPPARIQQLEGPLERARALFAQLDGIVGGAAAIADRLPYLLGADGTRTYLVIAQNNAEIRATGGFAGAWGTLSITDGHLDLGGFRALRGDVWPSPEQRPQITDEERALFGDAINTAPDNANMTPDFLRASELMRHFWAYIGEGEVQGVIALDPVLLQQILARVGGVTAADGTVVDGSNAARVLMSDTYARLGAEAQDDFFADVAELAFDRLVDGLGDLGITGVATLVNDCASSGRMLVWFEDPQAQSAVEALGMDGGLELDPAQQPVLGVYVNDDTWGKMCWYMELETEVSEPMVNADGSRAYQVTTTITNHMTSEEAASLPSYVTGTSPASRNPGDLVTHVLLLAPAGGSVTNVICSSPQVDGAHGGTLSGLEAWTALVNTNLGQETTVTYTVITAPGAPEGLVVRQTPTAQSFD